MQSRERVTERSRVLLLLGLPLADSHSHRPHNAQHSASHSYRRTHTSRERSKSFQASHLRGSIQLHFVSAHRSSHTCGRHQKGIKKWWIASSDSWHAARNLQIATRSVKWMNLLYTRVDRKKKKAKRNSKIASRVSHLLSILRLTRICIHRRAGSRTRI